VGRLTVRAADPDGDCAAVAALLAELGYPAEPAEARERLARLSADPASRALVAERDGAVVGAATLTATPLLERPAPSARLTALVVAERARRRGVARALVERAIEEARALGCFRLEVTSRPDRADAVSFYEALGFEERPRRLVRPL
jgi:GNAT superfamily N-acetyltransferase